MTSPSEHITDAMWWLWQQLQALEPTSKLGGIYANKPGYHNCRSNLPFNDYSVVDRPPDGGGPRVVAAALDWTFPEAQRGDYRRISKYTKRLLLSAKDRDDPRLNGWREFYGQSDTDKAVEGWDLRYGVPATSDASHLWHIHVSEDRDKATNRSNKEALLSVLKGETVQQWIGEEEDVSAKDVWAYDVNPDGTKTYTASGALWTVYIRSDWLNNTWAPTVTERLAAIEKALGIKPTSAAPLPPQT